jgi:hypothetical protein
MFSSSTGSNVATVAYRLLGRNLYFFNTFVPKEEDNIFFVDSIGFAIAEQRGNIFFSGRVKD